MESKYEILNQLDFKNGDYVCEGIRGFTFDQAIRIWKTQFPFYNFWEAEIIKHPCMNPLRDTVKAMWGNIEPYSKAEMQKLFPKDNRLHNYGVDIPEISNITSYQKYTESQSHEQSMNEIVNQIKNYRA